MNLDAIEACLCGFVHDNANDAALQGLPLAEDSARGARVQEREDLWFLGDWVVQGTPPRLEALWSMDVGPDETVRVIVQLEVEDQTCVVAKWDVEETF